MSTVPAALPSINTILALGDKLSPEGFDAIANIGDWSVSLSTTTKDVTSHSTGEPIRQKIATLRDTGGTSLPCYWIPDEATSPQHAALLQIWKDRELRNYQCWFPDDAETTYQFAGYIVGIDFDFSVEGVIKGTIKFEWTGDVDFDATKADNAAA